MQLALFYPMPFQALEITLEQLQVAVVEKDESVSELRDLKYQMQHAHDDAKDVLSSIPQHEFEALLSTEQPPEQIYCTVAEAVCLYIGASPLVSHRYVSDQKVSL
jgi:hypothetical protein